MNKRPVIFDVDGVLADFTLGFTQLADSVAPKGSPVWIRGTEEQHVWDFNDIPPAVLKEAWRIVKNDSDFWMNLPPLVSPYVFEHIAAIQYTREVYFATSRLGILPQQQTRRWLSFHGIKNASVIVTGRKGEFAKVVDAAASIDDKAGNAIYTAYESPSTKSFILDRLYNRFPHEVVGGRVERVSTVSGFIDIATRI